VTTRLRAFLAPIRGLRVRLLLGFAGLCVITAALVAGGMYVYARRVILQQAQDSAVIALTKQIKTVYPLHTLPPTQATLQIIHDDLVTKDSAVRVEYGTQLASGFDQTALITPELRAKIAQGEVAWQRVDWFGGATLVVGTELMIKGPSGGAKPSGVDVFGIYSLDAEAQSIRLLAYIAWAIGAIVLVMAMLLAIAVARSVLRPVRELRSAAGRLGAGELSTRVPVRGSDEFAQVAQTFNTTAQALEEHVAELRRMESDARRFVADVSHELRTPLAAMIAVVDVLDEQAAGLPELTGEAVRLVSQGTHNLTRLVNDLIEVTRFDSGTAALALDDIDLAPAIAATLRARGWTDAVQAELPAGVLARVDPRRLDVIMANLVGNALRHGAPPVSVRLRTEPDWLVIEVADHGPGLSEEVLPQVFHRFYKADTARTRSEGSGLGLAIAWENARLHRSGEREGSLVATNRPGGGALFILRLPVIEVPE
jgi:two-component system sensor histidine kinase MtrB